MEDARNEICEGDYRSPQVLFNLREREREGKEVDSFL